MVESLGAGHYKIYFHMDTYSNKQQHQRLPSKFTTFLFEIVHNDFK